MYKMAVAFMLAHPYGVTRLMSSYRWDRSLVEGRVGGSCQVCPLRAPLGQDVSDADK